MPFILSAAAACIRAQGSFLLLALLLPHMSVSAAPMWVLELDEGPNLERADSLYPAPGGGLLVHYPPPSAVGTPEHRLRYLNRQREQRWLRALPRLEQLAPWRRGYLAVQRLEPDIPTLIYYPLEGRDDGDVLFQAAAGDLGLRVAADPRARRFMAVAHGGFRWRLLQINGSGQVSQLYETPDGAFQLLALTAAGPAVLDLPTGQNVPPRLRAFDRRGRLRWETPVPLAEPRQLEPGPDGQLVIRAESGRVQLVDAATGALLQQLHLAQDKQLRSGPDSMLVFGQVRGHPLIRSWDSQGNSLWWRQFRLGPGPTRILDAAYQSSGRLALLADYETGGLGTRKVILYTDATGESLSRGFGACFDADPLSISALEARLAERFGVGVRRQPVLQTDRPGEDARCQGPSQSAYLSFLTRLDQALSETAGDRQFDVPVEVSFGDWPALWQRESGTGGAAEPQRFLASPGAGRVLARAILAAQN